MEASEILKLINEAHDAQREDIKKTGENQMDLSERVLANLSVATTIKDGSRLLELAASDPT